MKFKCTNISEEHGLGEDHKLGGRTSVGIFKNNTEYSIKTPYGLLLPNTIYSTERDKIDFLKKYARCITKALSKDKTRRILEASTDAKNNPLSALNVVLDYVQNGQYKEFESETVIRQIGKIDFKKTMSRVKPIIYDDEALYSEFAVSRKKVASQEIVSIAQGNVINHFMEHGGEILFGNLIRVNVPKIALDGGLVNKLCNVKANSFNSRKQQLVQWIIDYIQGAANQKETGSWQYAIVASTLWEEMIDACFSNQVIRNKTRYGRQYAMIQNGQVIRVSAPTQHDTIYETDREIIIIDAKMYYNKKGLVNSEVLEKQFGYYSEAKRKNPDKRVFNVLIKPHVINVDNETGVQSYIPSPDICDDPHNFILVYTIDFSEVMNAYYLGKKISLKLLSDIEHYISSEFSSF